MSERCELCNKKIKNPKMITFKIFKPVVCGKCEEIFIDEVVDKGLDRFYKRIKKECVKQKKEKLK